MHTAKNVFVLCFCTWLLCLLAWPSPAGAIMQQQQHDTSASPSGLSPPTGWKRVLMSVPYTTTRLVFGASKARKLALKCDRKPLGPAFTQWRTYTKDLLFGHTSTKPQRKRAGGNKDNRQAPPKAQAQANEHRLVSQARVPPLNTRLPECGLMNLSQNLAGEWVKQHGSGQLTYQPAICRIRQMAQQEALACLSSRHVVMVGDSLMRFQFIALAHFLLHGRFQDAYDVEPGGLSLLPPGAKANKAWRLPAGPPPSSTDSSKRRRPRPHSHGLLEEAEVPDLRPWDLARTNEKETSPDHTVHTHSHGLLEEVEVPGLRLDADLKSLATGTTEYVQPMTVEESSVDSNDMDGWAKFYARTQQLLTRAGCVNTTCNYYRNPADHAPGMHPLSRAHEYWRVRMLLEDDSTSLLSMALVYAFPDFPTAGVNGLRWAFTAAKQFPPDMILFNMGLWWGNVHAMGPPEVSLSQVVTAFEEIFEWGQQYVRRLALPTRLVYMTTVPVMEVAAHTVVDNYWWRVWPTMVEPLLVPLAKAYGWEVFDTREVVTAAHKQGLPASWDALHLYPFMYEAFNDLLLNSMCDSGGGWHAPSSHPPTHAERVTLQQCPNC